MTSRNNTGKMLSRSPSHRSGRQSRDRTQYLRTRRSSSPSERRSESSRGTSTPRRRSRSQSKTSKEKSFSPGKRKASPKAVNTRHKSSPHSDIGKKEPHGSVRNTKPLGERARHRSDSPESKKEPHGTGRNAKPLRERSRNSSDSPESKKEPHGSVRNTKLLGERCRHRSDSRERSQYSKDDKPVFRGPEGGVVKFDSKELKRIKVDIFRTLPKKEKPVIQRSILNPEIITPVRRPDEGTRPIFARPELKTRPRNEDSPEDRRVGSRKSIENDSRHKSERSDPSHSSSYYRHKSRDRSPYDHKRPRSRSPLEQRHSKYYRRSEDRHGPDRRRGESKYYSRERHADDRLDREKIEGRYHASTSQRSRIKSEGGRSHHRSRSPSYSRRGHRRSREREDKKVVAEGSRERQVEKSREQFNEGEEEEEEEEYVEQMSIVRAGRGGVMRGPRPIRPHPLGMGVWPQPMMRFRPPIPYMMPRPGFGPPRPPPYPPPRYYPPY